MSCLFVEDCPRAGGCHGESVAHTSLLTRPSLNTYYRLTANRVAEGGSRREDLDVPPDALSRPAPRLRKAVSLGLGRPAVPRAVHAGEGRAVLQLDARRTDLRG